VAAQTDEEKAAARALATQGGEALAASKYADALELLSRAEQLLHAPTHLLMIARSQVGLGRLVAAKETYLRLMREELAPSAPGAFKRAQQEARNELSAIDPRIGQLRIMLEGAGQKQVTVKMDDQPVSPALVGVYRPLDPGRHEVVVYPAGQAPVKATIELKDGEKKEIKLSISDAPPASGASPGLAGAPDSQGSLSSSSAPDTPPAGGADQPGFFTPLRTLGVGLGGVGVVGVTVGSIFVAKGFGASSDATAKFDACPRPCPPEQQKEIKNLDSKAARSKSIGGGALVVGGLALGAGIALIVVGKPAPKSAGAYVTPWFSGNAGGLRGEF
jgi:hypothetical protein